MIEQNRSFERYLFLLAFISGLGMRFLQLGHPPLSDSEAVWALQSLELARGSFPVIGSQPVYVALTGALMFLFDGSNFIARFWPAVAGSLLVLVPLFVRKELGATSASILAVFLAVDPGMVAISRQVGSPMIALSALILAWAAWRSARPHLVGVFGVLAFLSGPSAWFGLLGMALVWSLVKGFESGAGPDENLEDPEEIPASQPDLRTILWFALGMLILLIGLLLRAQNIFSAPFGAVIEFIRGWWNPSGIPAWQQLVALLVYQPLAFILAVVGVIRGWRANRFQERSLAVFFLVFLVLALVYPARTAGYLVWCLLPLWALAAVELSRHLDFDLSRIWETLGMVALTLTILVFVWFDLAGLAFIPFNSDQAVLRLVVGGVALVLLGLSAVLVALGWSIQSARLGLVWGFVIAMGLYTFAGSIGASGGLRASTSVELWKAYPQVSQAGLLSETMDDLSEWKTGHRRSLPVVIWDVDSPALRWLIRDWSYQETNAISSTGSPELVITPGERTELGLSASYRGQDFVWRTSPKWDLALPNERLRWFMFRQIPQDLEKIILWARIDIFPDSALQPKNP